MVPDPYDEVPYKSLPIEWTAPERLGLASLLHGGPRPSLVGYRVLELGCGDGANLLPQAYYRPHASFVGVDRAGTQIDAAESSRLELQLTNIEFIRADFLGADDCLEGQFDYIIGHGVFSWVADDARDALLRLCARRLRVGGLLYLNYNAYPGWKVRGMVRDFLLAQTAAISGLRMRAQAARDVAGRVAEALPPGEHAYSNVLANEFRFVHQSELSYVAHEYLAADNRPYWRSEFMALAQVHGFEYVADADFNYDTGRVTDGFRTRLVEEQITGRTIDDTIDFLSYRQLHSPILTPGPFARRPCTVEEFATLTIASRMIPRGHADSGPSTFEHPSGYEVEVADQSIRVALERLYVLWPRGVPVATVFPNVQQVFDDVLLLHRHGLLELRCVDVGGGVASERLQRVENERGGYFTTPYHTREAAVAVG